MTLSSACEEYTEKAEEVIFLPTSLLSFGFGPTRGQVGWVRFSCLTIFFKAPLAFPCDQVILMLERRKVDEDDDKEVARTMRLPVKFAKVDLYLIIISGCPVVLLERI